MLKVFPLNRFGGKAIFQYLLWAAIYAGTALHAVVGECALFLNDRQNIDAHRAISVALFTFRAGLSVSH